MAAKIIFISAAIMSIAVVYLLSKTKKPFVTACKSALSGICALMLVNLTGMYTGCYITVNYITAFVATVLSLPGVVALVLLNLVFM